MDVASKQSVSVRICPGFSHLGVGGICKSIPWPGTPVKVSLKGESE